MLRILLFALLLPMIPAFAQDVVIVEVEPNPSGADSGNEWVRLFNTGPEEADLSGWTLSSTGGDARTHELSGTVPRCGGVTVILPGQFIDNSQDLLILYDASGNAVDSTPAISDTGNDSWTWKVDVPECAPAGPAPDGPLEVAGVLNVVFVDLKEKGESILVLFPNKKVMLIDGGMPNSYPNLEAALKQNNVTAIDVMVATHADQDHIAGLTEVLRDGDFAVQKVLISHVPSTSQTYANFIAAVRNEGLEPIEAFDGYEIGLDPAVDASVVSPPQAGLEEGANASKTNTNSLVIRMTYGNVSFLFTGDATHVTEEWLAQSRQHDANIMNAPHHGSKYSSTPEFIAAFDPEVVVFSADIDNVHGHPHQEAIERYGAHSEPIALHQTGTEGHITVSTDGTRCSLIIQGNEQACYPGVAAVPEFPLALLILVLAVAGAILATSTPKLGQLACLGK